MNESVESGISISIHTIGEKVRHEQTMGGDWVSFFNIIGKEAQHEAVGGMTQQGVAKRVDVDWTRAERGF